MCIWDSYVYQVGFLCFLIHKSLIRSIKRYCFVRKYAAIPVQIEIFILQYIGWRVLIIWTFIINQFGCFCQFLMDNFGYSIIIIIIIIIIIETSLQFFSVQFVGYNIKVPHHAQFCYSLDNGVSYAVTLD